VTEKRVSGDRTGYREDFLGRGVHRVQIPWLSDRLYAQVALNHDARSSRHVLPYRHFSIVMNRDRRLAFFTAVNIDGNQFQRPDDESGNWSFDDRIDREAQLAGDFYGHNPFDRGHLVRRLDPAWGPDVETAGAAIEDTFHWTNCGPQHEDFNRQQGLWADLENYILYNTNNRELKVSVFTGPVFRGDDPIYREVAVPQQYWKVVTMVKQDGSLSATAYLVSQKELVDDFLTESFAFGRFKTLQIPIRELETKIEMSFRELGDHDPMAVGSDRERPRALRWKEILTVNDVRI
jgi:endonuclease G